SGFHYRGSERRVTIDPPLAQPDFHSFWSTGTGWGTFSLPGRGAFTLNVIEGNLPLRGIEFPSAGSGAWKVSAGTAPLAHNIHERNGRATVTLSTELKLTPEAELTFTPHK
ncbi:MAG: GH116 family glycosyl-hydrolase, partial [Bryobacteraceae bacterium]